MTLKPVSSKPLLNRHALVRLVIHLALVHFAGSTFGQQASPMGHSGPLPDPRFRTAIGLQELQNLVNLIVAKNGLQARVTVVEDMSGTVAVARVSGVALSARIEVNPQLARTLPPNSWAFILGHEIAHLVDARARQGYGTNFQSVEWNADLIGAGYAQRGGFDLAAHLGWIFSRPNQGSPNYGSDHERAMHVARHFAVDWGAVRACQARYGRSVAVPVRR